MASTSEKTVPTLNVLQRVTACRVGQCSYTTRIHDVTVHDLCHRDVREFVRVLDVS